MLPFVPPAVACEESVYAALPIPPAGEDGRGYVDGVFTEKGVALVGARLTLKSRWPYEAWRRELLRPEHHDEWQPKEFGNELAEAIDPRHLYLRANVGFLFDAVQVRRQLVAEITLVDTASLFRSCWHNVDPAPFRERLAGLVTDAPWEKAIYGGWDVTPAPGGGTTVSYQWWIGSAGLPVAVQRWAIGRTLPALLAAYEAHVGDEVSRR
ncbi:MAG: hypothetical protein ACOZNI_24575 [Myxococcota bacterium]